MIIQNFQGALRIYLLADNTIKALVDDKIFAYPAPQSTEFPYVIIQRISKEVINNLNEFAEVVSERYQIDVYSQSLDDSEAIAKAVFDRLHMKNHFDMSGYTVYLIQFSNENETFEPENDGSESVYYRISQDFIIKHSYNAL